MVGLCAWDSLPCGTRGRVGVGGQGLQVAAPARCWRNATLTPTLSRKRERGKRKAIKLKTTRRRWAAILAPRGRRRTVPFIANLHKSWAGCEAAKFFENFLGRPVTLVNDADGAGLAETHYGAAKGNDGLVIMTTLGTGIGTAIIYRGVLIPNAELGHVELDGHDAESRAASSIKDREGLSYKEWAVRLQRYYRHLEMLFSPDLSRGPAASAPSIEPLIRAATAGAEAPRLRA